MAGQGNNQLVANAPMKSRSRPLLLFSLLVALLSNAPATWAGDEGRDADGAPILSTHEPGFIGIARGGAVDPVAQQSWAVVGALHGAVVIWWPAL